MKDLKKQTRQFLKTCRVYNLMRVLVSFFGIKINCKLKLKTIYACAAFHR